MNRGERIKGFLIRHRRLIRGIIGLFFFFLTLVFVFAALTCLSVFGAFEPYLVGGILLFMFASRTWRVATDFEDWDQDGYTYLQDQIDRLEFELDHHAHN